MTSFEVLLQLKHHFLPPNVYNVTDSILNGWWRPDTGYIDFVHNKWKHSEK